MEPEFWIKTALAIVGTALIAAGIFIIIKSKKNETRVWGVVATAAGVIMWLVILFTTIVSSTAGY